MPGQFVGSFASAGWVESKGSTRRQPGFFNVDLRLKRSSDLSDQLEAFRGAVDFETFRPALKAVLYIPTFRKADAPVRPVMMFKNPVPQTANNLPTIGRSF